MAYYNSAYEGQPQVQYQAPIVSYAAPTITHQPKVIKHFGPYYKRKTSTGLGATQIVIACISIGAGIMAILSGAPLFYVGIGIWTGVWYLIAGSLAIAAGKNPTNSLITATLVFSVFDILFAIGQITTASLGVAEDEEVYCDGNFNPYDYCHDWWEAGVAANCTMIAVGSLEIIFGFLLMGFSARAIDKGSKSQLATIPVTYAPNHPQPVFIQAPPGLQSQPSSLQPQPPFLQPQPPPYCEQPQYPSTSNQQQMMYVGVHQAPLTNIKL